MVCQKNQGKYPFITAKNGVKTPQGTQNFAQNGAFRRQREDVQDPIERRFGPARMLFLSWGGQGQTSKIFAVSQAEPP